MRKDTIVTVRGILFDELEMFRAGKSDLDRARTVAEMAAQAVYSFRVEIENKKLELDIAKADKEAQKWMEKDFSNISKMRKSA